MWCPGCQAELTVYTVPFTADHEVCHVKGQSRVRKRANSRYGLVAICACGTKFKLNPVYGPHHAGVPVDIITDDPEIQLRWDAHRLEARL